MIIALRNSGDRNGADNSGANDVKRKASAMGRHIDGIDAGLLGGRARLAPGRSGPSAQRRPYAGSERRARQMKYAPMVLSQSEFKRQSRA